MTSATLDLPLILPRGAECSECIEELGGELLRLRGVREVTPNATRGLLHVSFDNDVLAYDDLTRDARRIGSAAHCAVHCPRGQGAGCTCRLEIDPAGADRYEQRLAHVTGLDCADCALKLEGALQHAPGVVSATTSFGASTLKIVYDPDRTDYGAVLDRVRRLGYDTVEGRQARERERAQARVAHAPKGGPLVFDVRGMDCADCAARLENRLGKLDGVDSVRVDFGLARLTANLTDGAASAASTEAALAATPPAGGARAAAPAAPPAATARQMGYRLIPSGAGTSDGAAAGATSAAQERSLGREPRTALTAVSGVAVAAGFAAYALAPALAPWLFAVAVVTGGWLTARAAWYSVRAHSVDMNVLMTLAAVGAAALGQWSEAGLIVFLFSLGNLLQAWTMERTRRAVKGLVSLTPSEARLIEAGQTRTVAAATLLPGDVVQVLPGERLPVDGTVLDGQAGVDQSPVTGESMPVGKAPGDEVFAGSIVQGGALTVRATTSASDNTIAKIIHLVEEAQAQRAPVQTTVDRFAARYTPVVVGLAVAVALVPPIFFGQAFDTWFYRGLALLIISCPCALVISTPVSILAALGAAGRRGVLIKGGAYLEQAGRLRAVAFDKTGTLTTGVPQVTDVVSLNGDTGERVLALAAAVERQSEHPLAHAIVDEADRLAVPGSVSLGPGDARAQVSVATARSAGATVGCTDDCCCDVGGGQAEHDHEHDSHEDDHEHVHADHTHDHGHDGDGHEHDHGHEGDGHEHAAHDGPAVTRFRAIAGQGVRADVDGETVLIGKPAMFGDAPTRNGLFAAEVRRLELEGKTVVVVGTPERVDGLIAVADAIRPHAAEAVRALRASGVRHVALLTGDNQQTAEAIGRAAGADVVRAGLLPEQKVAAVRELNERYGAVAMVGDGVNDAPALAAASLGVAMGAAGTDAALETADIALMGDDLTAVAATVALSRRTTRVIVENIVLSIAIKSVFLVLAPLGLIPLWLAVFADMGTSLAVIGNGMRLRFAVRR